MANATTRTAEPVDPTGRFGDDEGAARVRDSESTSKAGVVKPSKRQAATSASQLEEKTVRRDPGFRPVKERQAARPRPSGARRQSIRGLAAANETVSPHGRFGEGESNEAQVEEKDGSAGTSAPEEAYRKATKKQASEGLVRRDPAYRYKRQ